MTSPNTMKARRAIIAELIASEIITSQEDLIDSLHRQGFQVTQATVSRDLDALGAVKHSTAGGTSRYVIAERIARDTSLPSGGSEHELMRVCAEVLLKAQAAGNIAVLHTPPGAAQYLAGYLDRSRIFDNVGTVAGDDTIMIVMPSPQSAQDLCTAVVEWAEAHG